MLFLEYITVFYHNYVGEIDLFDLNNGDSIKRIWNYNKNILWVKDSVFCYLYDLYPSNSKINIIGHYYYQTKFNPNSPIEEHHFSYFVQMDFLGNIIINKEIPLDDYRISYLEDRQQPILSRGDGGIYLYDIQDSSFKDMLVKYTSMTSDLAVTKNSEYIISGHRDGQINVFDQTISKLVDHAELTDWVNTIAISPDNTMLAVGCNDGTLWMLKSDFISSVQNPKQITENNIKIYPNPASSIINFEFNLNQTVPNSELVIFDMYGKEIMRKHIDINSYGQKYPMDLGNIDSGVLMYKLIAGNEIYFGKIIKIK